MTAQAVALLDSCLGSSVPRARLKPWHAGEASRTWWSGHFTWGYGSRANAWNTAPHRALVQAQVKVYRCPASTDSPTYDDRSRGVLVPGRAAASYAVVISGTIDNNNHNDDGSAGSPMQPYNYCELSQSRLNGPFNQNVRYN